ncbi:tyrosine-type recombinase/integrase [Haladaptatus pallidirubidus]|uniref:Integrase/recombinase XerD n=1 Tax=Haladaptatus pallidirubidus TaxID=1008152 RepID=A0AAV3UM18_9EURY|nr:tyrosine-type recombinase/integrase [Haladaptatus pallidirubidus]
MVDLIERFLRKERIKKSERTTQHRKSNLTQFEQWLQEESHGDLTQVTSFDIEDHLLSLSESGRAPKTVRGRYDALCRFYGVLSDDPRFEEIDEDPTEDFDASELKNIMSGTKKAEALKQDIFYVTPEQKELLTENVPNPKLRNALICRLLWQTGIRQGELTEIKLSDINRDERSIRIRAEKTYSNRMVYYQSSLDFLMNQWIDGGYRSSHITASDSPYLFLTYKAPSIKKNYVNDIVKDAARKAGIQETMYKDASGNSRHKITSHALRHGFAVQSLKNRMDIRTLSSVLGHSNLETTKKYLRLNDDDVRDAVRKFGAGTESVESETR